MTSASSASPLSLDRRTLLWLAGAVSLSVGAYLAASVVTFRIGFPLDDAWIHQAYARSLAEHGQWALIPGRISAGSTSPLWSALLALGYWLRLAPYAWTYLLGTLTLFALALCGELAARRIFPTYRGRIPWIGLFLALEWHLVWASVSGMETLLHALLCLLVIYHLFSPAPRPLSLGLLVGLSVWVRPDGLTLLLPVGLVLLFPQEHSRPLDGDESQPGLGLPEKPLAWVKRRVNAILRFGIAFGVVFAFYILFNLLISGKPMPNTFYAKQAEFASALANPLWQRFWVMFRQSLFGPGLFLLPGAVGWGVDAIRRRERASLAALLWYVAYLGLYAIRLPVAYQLGRYSMPAMPAYFLFGLLGLASFRSSELFGRFHRWVELFWQAFVIVLCLVFWGLGGYTFGQNVAYIESEMVEAARWVDANLPPDALIATHDIGALGYFARRDLLDLAGLVSPEVIPFMHDEPRLARYLDERGADYLVTFPDWYPQLVEMSEPVYRSRGVFAPTIGAENIGVYRWRLP